ncbi:bifunctional 5,10-methylenetetrahydrofolate dehydrogenase/5,10-methenyltetrahydrofolate cyclohydrolase [Devosia nitrariae]|uniref:Bifunctional protein FolD n=1 Tax=Devosia nitrariae TaxID=2071872 RepID=A0ABQ5W7H1_9HYPH|nr:bifunctional 5,10-methylenetetrahydrofolate dehydrogenase/5,10-methenyltetrahydrofolate cyclohydrolase [Devosia nitrariae]GLQ55759.1 bifunctional 5,10-methylene-tetrahydrofolate dehydrogenase/5,10-methylene-tetrahydrofolate cyclohydrolase [Devosia nitrariae]
MAPVLTSKELVEGARREIVAHVAEEKQAGRVPCMAVVVATDDSAALSYARVKDRIAKELGIEVRIEVLDASTTQAALNQRMEALSNDPMVHGVLLELPLRRGLDANIAINCLAPQKDIDGLSDFNVARVAVGNEEVAIAPATPQACIAPAESETKVAGKLVTVIGRGRTVGRPLAHMLINRGATVIHCHSGTSDLPSLTSQCDILFTATGRAGLVGAAHVRAGQVVVDAGTDYSSGKVLGDVDAEAVGHVVKAYTPVPGGVGPLTTVFLFKNLLKAIALQTGSEQ